MFRKTVLILLLLLPGCGFKPVYKQDNPAAAQLERINITVEALQSHPNRTQQLLQNKLGQLFDPFSSRKEKLYNLTITLAIHNEGVNIKPDTTALTIKKTIAANCTLVDLKTDKELFKDKLLTITSYDTVDSPYSAYVTEVDTVEKMIQNLAYEIKTRTLVNMIDMEADRDKR